jgi:acetyltransferase-like isoleucine patch superfamily enzyme
MKKYLIAIKRMYLRMIALQARPIMVYYSKNFQRESRENIRISTSTFFDYKNRLKISDHCFIGHFNFIEASHFIEIGEGVQITNYCSITTHSSHHSIRLYGKRFKSTKKPKGYIKGPISIGDYTFVGPHSTIMPNTKIGKGCLISAYSYVQGDFPDFSIIAGQPAKIIGNTTELDKKYLDEYPELKTFYEEWVK